MPNILVAEAAARAANRVDRRFVGGDASRKVATFETVVQAGLDAYVILALPSNAVVTRIQITSDAAITSGAANWGVATWDAKSNALVPVDADLFGSAVNLAGTAGTWVDITFESGAIDIANLGRPLWQNAGLAADPGGSFWLVATETTTAGGAGTVTVMVDYY